MGYRSTLRTFGAIARSMERDARRQQRELERQQKYLAKMQELERAEYEVSVYENKIEVIKSLHKDCSDSLDWESIKNSNPLPEPVFKHTKEIVAQKTFDGFRPNIFHRLFGMTEKKKNLLLKKIEESKKADQEEHKKECEHFQVEYQNWKKATETAVKVLEGNVGSYMQVIKEENPFKEIEQLGSGINFNVINKHVILASIEVFSDQAIPTEVKSLLKSGKLSIKPMPKSRFHELYQDYVCSNVFRVARELFSLLPIKITIINAVSNMLNTKTGYKEDMVIFSVTIPRKTLDALNFASIDSSDAIHNFVHKMNFKKSSGFAPIEPLNPDEYVKD